MVSVQAQCTLREAMALMQDTAAAAEVTLDQLADEIVERRVRFDHSRLRHGYGRAN